MILIYKRVIALSVAAHQVSIVPRVTKEKSIELYLKIYKSKKVTSFEYISGSRTQACSSNTMFGRKP